MRSVECVVTDDEILGVCRGCNRQLLLNAETGLCLRCEIDALRARLYESELQIASLMRERRDLKNRLSLQSRCVEHIPYELL